MIDILKEAREYTREEFLNEAAKCGSLFLCPRYSGLNQKCLSIVYDEKKCKECWREAVKDITFKGEELTVICINDKTERDKKIKVLGITEGKEYPVKLCRYPNYYELVNDLGQVETYFMDRFEIIENKCYHPHCKECKEFRCTKYLNVKNCVSVKKGATKMDAKNNGNVELIIKEKLQEAVNNYFEGDKMEDKAIKKVRCIKKCAEDLEALIINKEYPVLEESKDCYLISNDKDFNNTWYSKDLFEKVEDVLMVECVDNTGYEGHLILNKKYQVLEEDAIHYFIKNELDNKTGYLKSRFKPVEPQKEIKEYSVMELLDFPVGTKFKTKNTIVEVIECDEDNKIIILSGGNASSGLNITTANREAKFTLIEEPKPVSFIEAWKIYEEGKTIESLESKNKYKKDEDPDGGLLVKKESESIFHYALGLSTQEIEGLWIIIKGDK